MKTVLKKRLKSLKKTLAVTLALALIGSSVTAWAAETQPNEAVELQEEAESQETDSQTSENQASITDIGNI